VDERARKLGLNEAAFRSANERVRKVAEGFSLVADRTNFICECGSSACTEPISLTMAEYEHVRSDPRWFATVPGHESPEVERVVEDHGNYVVLEKLPGGPAGLAIREDDSR
jgi:hypothetical protein